MSDPVPVEPPGALDPAALAEHPAPAAHARVAAPSTPVTRAERRAIPMMAIGHATVDFYQGAVPCLVPFLVAERHYGYVAASGIVLAATLLSSIVQPLFGALTDRWTMPWLIPVSTTGAGLGIALAGPADSYVLTWLAIALSGMGVAAYHPESARLARVACRGSHVAMGWYSLGGNIGFALAPVVASPILSAGGLGATPWLLLPAVAGVLVTASVIRGLARHAAATRAGGGVRPADDWPRFARLSAVIVCRSIVFIGLSTFIALYAEQHTAGGSTAGSIALFTLFAGGAIGTVLGGRLAARRGRIRTLRRAYAASVPATAGIVLVPGPARPCTSSSRPPRSPSTSRSPCTSPSARTTCPTASAPRAASPWAWPSASAAWPPPRSAPSPNSPPCARPWPH